MSKRIAALITIVVLSGQAHALSLEVIGSAVAKFFKGGVAKEAATAGKVDGYAVAKGLEHLPAGEAVLRAGPALQTIEPKPNMAAEPITKNRKDADAYKVLRTAAEKGDAAAMLRMSEMTSTGRVYDPGEPWYGYWMFQAVRLSNQAAAKKARDECSAREYRRATDRWFDTACGSTDGQTLYLWDKPPGAYSTSRPDSVYRATQPWSK